MQRFKTYISIGAALLLTALASCNKTDDIGGTLPDGTTPISFTATLDNLNVTTGEVGTRSTVGNTRATRANAAPVGAAIAISSDGGATSKTYTVASGGSTLTPAGDPLYWKKATETLAAWTPATIVSGTPTDASQYNIATQTAYTGGSSSSGSSSGSFENVLHAPAKGYDFRGTTPAALTLRHAFAKVNITLTAGDGVSDDEITNATVKLSGYTSGTMGYNGLVGSGANDGIEPTATLANGITTFSAYLIPQQMNGKRFIRVTSNGNSYYYTPANATEANLTAGKAYTYNVTVNKDELIVTVKENGVQWTDSETTGNAADATFHITMPTGHNQTLTPSSNATPSGSNYDVTGSSFTLSYTVADADKLKGFLAVKGLCDFKRSFATDNGTTTYTFTYSNIRSDLWLNYTKYAEVGDYYYSDGTWSPIWNNSGKTCIGIVFKSGAGMGDAVSNYDNNTFTDNTIHGYAVALQDAGSGTCIWGERKDAGTVFVDDASDKSYNGYTNTKTIQAFAAGLQTINYPYEAFNRIAGFASANVLPAQTSGWFIPSLGQLSDIWKLYKHSGGNILYDRLQTASGSLFVAPNTNVGKGVGGYWTSTEHHSDDAWFIQMTIGDKLYHGKNNYMEWGCRPSLVRLVFAF